MKQHHNLELGERLGFEVLRIFRCQEQSSRRTLRQEVNTCRTSSSFRLKINKALDKTKDQTIRWQRISWAGTILSAFQFMGSRPHKIRAIIAARRPFDDSHNFII